MFALFQFKLTCHLSWPSYPHAVVTRTSALNGWPISAPPKPLSGCQLEDRTEGDSQNSCLLLRRHNTNPPGEALTFMICL